MKLITVFPTLSSPIINILYNGFSNIIFIKPDTSENIFFIQINLNVFFLFLKLIFVINFIIQGKN
jgi:hypothetical protein